MFGLVALVLSAGAGLYIPAVELLNRLFEKTSQALGIHHAGGSIADVVVPAIAFLISDWVRWRSAVLVATLEAVVACLVVSLATRRITQPWGSPRKQFRVPV